MPRCPLSLRLLCLRLRLIDCLFLISSTTGTFPSDTFHLTHSHLTHSNWQLKVCFLQFPETFLKATVFMLCLRHVKMIKHLLFSRCPKVLPMKTKKRSVYTVPFRFHPKSGHLRNCILAIPEWWGPCGQVLVRRHYIIGP